MSGQLLSQIFFPNLSSILSPFHLLLCKGTKWNWTQRKQVTFDKVKELLKSSAQLLHFDSTKLLLVYADASPNGVGAVQAHKMPDNSEKPIAFVSRTLTPVERNYSQLEKEAYLFKLLSDYSQVPLPGDPLSSTQSLRPGHCYTFSNKSLDRQGSSIVLCQYN